MEAVSFEKVVCELGYIFTDMSNDVEKEFGNGNKDSIAACKA